MIKLKNLSRHPMNLNQEVVDMLSTFPCLILAGGAIRDSLKGREISDYDLFFTDKNYIDRVRDKLVELKAELTFACPQGMLYSYTLGEVKVQLICKRQYSGVRDLLDSFDFSICYYALTSEGVVYTNKEAVRDNKKMHLRLINLEYPSATMNRIYKYRKKGFYTGQAIKSIVERLVQMDVRDYNPEDDSLYVD